MRYLIAPTTGHVELVEGPVPTIGPGELLIRMQACGVCGSDLLKVFSPQIPKPVHLGHEIVGVVAQTGEGVANFTIGQRVALAHHAPDYSSHYTRRGSGPMDPTFRRSNVDPGGFSEYIRIPAPQVTHTAQGIPDSVPNLRAVFMEPLACCLRALERAPVLEGDTVLVVGVGAIGILFVPLLHERSTTVFVTDVRPERIELAQEWGAAGGWTAEDAEPELFWDVSQGRGCDLVLLTVVTEATMALAVRLLRDGGTILLFGAKPGLVVPLDMWGLWKREINLVASYSATPDLMPRAMAILLQKAYPFEKTISHVLPLDQAEYGFQLAHRGQASKVVLLGDRI